MGWQRVALVSRRLPGPPGLGSHSGSLHSCLLLPPPASDVPALSPQGPDISPAHCLQHGAGGVVACHAAALQVLWAAGR